jgi:site-specific DNA recombinase
VIASQNYVAGTSAKTLNPAGPQIIVIDPVVQEIRKKQRTAAYARVSSDSDDQQNSFAAQVSYYTTLIGGTEEWELVDIYADEGITGLRMDKRDDFLRMIRDCRKGKIDRILTKSISRFSRNTRECLQTIRELKAIGVTIYFEKERLDTAEISDEMLLTFFSGNAQQESMTISTNMRWSYQRRMKKGAYVASSTPYGYTLKDMVLTVDEEQARTVRWIFNSYLSGKSMQEIAQELSDTGVKAKDGRSQWHHTAISYILQNERYIGDKLYQKTFATDTLPFRQVRNKGERNRYYIKNAHPPIIEREPYDQVQRLIAERREQYVSPSSRETYPLSRIIKCGECGTLFKRKVTNGKVYWVCRNHNLDKSNCSLTPIPEAEIYTAFHRMYHRLKLNYDTILCPMLDQHRRSNDIEI